MPFHDQFKKASLRASLVTKRLATIAEPDNRTLTREIITSVQGVL